MKKIIFGGWEGNVAAKAATRLPLQRAAGKPAVALSPLRGHRTTASIQHATTPVLRTASVPRRIPAARYVVTIKSKTI